MLKKTLFISLLIMILSIVSACHKVEEKNVKENYYCFEDYLGFNVELTHKPENVVALIGSYAETYMLAGGELKGVTSDALTERNMDLPDNVNVVGTVKDPNLEEILNISPDFVLLSPDIESHKKISITLKELNVPHAFFKVEHFDDYLDMLRICTDITGNKEMYKKNGTDIKEDINKVLSSVKKDKQPVVLLIRAFSTGAKAKGTDNITGEMLYELGCDNIAKRHNSLLDTLSMEEVISEDPDYIFVLTMGDSEKAMETLKNGIQKSPAWSNLSAVKNDRYIILPKDLFHFKPNARWGEAYEYLAKILYR